jgi:glycosyltransferase involved in cell wall biosynthesis
MSKIDLSIVVSCYYVSDIISELVQEISLNTSFTDNYELILVNDFSRDNTENVITEICKKNNSVKLLSLSRNFGQQIAMSAGIAKSSGEYVIIMDGDLQNPPSAIPKLHQELKKGVDLVYTVSKTRNNIKNALSSRIFWFVVTKIFKVDIVTNQLMMKGFTKLTAERYADYIEINRTVAGIFKDVTDNCSVLEIENNKRLIGVSNYSFFKRLNLMIDIVIDLTTYPLNLMIYFGVISSLITSVLGIYFITVYLFYDVPAGFTSLLLSVLFFGSLITFILGFIGRYLANIYIEVKRRSLYHVKKEINF